MQLLLSDCTIYYEEQGTGETLVLLHGNEDNSRYFKHQIQYFKENYHVIAIDTRGHGQSERGSKPFTTEQFAEDLYEIVNKLQLDSIHLLGFSDGGNTAIAFALKHQERLKSLILNGANLNASAVYFRYQVPIVLGYGLVTAISIFCRKAMLKKEMLGLMVIYPGIHAEELRKIKVPVLVIVGDKDMIKEPHSQLIASSCQDNRFVVLKGGHCIASQVPEIYNQELELFLDEIGQFYHGEEKNGGNLQETGS